MISVGVLEAGTGNIPSVIRVLRQIGVAPKVINKPSDLDEISHLIMPGVGSFPFVMKTLKELGCIEKIQDKISKKKIEILGICLGAQILFETGEEIEETAGISLIDGRISELRPLAVKIPHTGWSDVKFIDPIGPFMKDEIVPFYFNHSFKFNVSTNHGVKGTCHYGEEFPVLIELPGLMAVQFHPEKSQEQGLKLLSYFITKKLT